MKFPEIERIVLDAVDAMVAAGVSREAACKAMQDAEFVAIRDLVETQSDKRFLDLFEQVGSAALAERHNVSAKTICRRRGDAMDRLYRKEIGQSVSPCVSVKAA